MENASAAFREAVRRSMRAIRQVLGSTLIDPALLTSAERIQYDSFQRRKDSSQAIKALATSGESIKEITRSRMQEPHMRLLRAEWKAGCRSGAELWRRL